METTIQAYFKATKAIENVLGPEQAKPVIEALNFGISAIENKGDEQRPILKAEIKDEMSKELASKADLAMLKTELKADINRVRAEVKSDIDKVKAEVNQLRYEMKYNFRIIWIFMGIIVFFSASANPIFQNLFKMFIKLPK